MKRPFAIRETSCFCPRKGRGRHKCTHKALEIDMNLVWVYVYSLDEVIGCTLLGLQGPRNDQKAQRIQTVWISRLPRGCTFSIKFTDTDKTLRYTHKHTSLLLQALKGSQPQVKTDPIFCLLWRRSSSVHVGTCMCAHSVGLSSTTECIVTAVRAEENCMI